MIVRQKNKMKVKKKINNNTASSSLTDRRRQRFQRIVI
jgi:hypothetical protein